MPGKRASGEEGSASHMTAHNINKPMCACSFAALPHNVLISQAALRATLTFEKLLIHGGGESVSVGRRSWKLAGSSEELLALNGNAVIMRS